MPEHATSSTSRLLGDPLQAAVEVVTENARLRDELSLVKNLLFRQHFRIVKVLWPDRDPNLDDETMAYWEAHHD